jgi:hypothetical protein
VQHRAGLGCRVGTQQILAWKYAQHRSKMSWQQQESTAGLHQPQQCHHQLTHASCPCRKPYCKGLTPYYFAAVQLGLSGNEQFFYFTSLVRSL